ncbi:MAG: DNA-protecting protein DprA [Alphaproteobacteria bacterium]|nr:DNA-protecting protein DprA [Alphaproteobacteria bacterium]MCB9696094.1 DNA-protecting protein DprA [Alphaproteobacteria bacterium]
MDVVSGFWAAMSELWRKRDLGAPGCELDIHTLAASAGGWARLAAASPSRWVSLGLRLDVAQRIARTPPLETAGRAITLACSDYPTRLLEWSTPPPVLFVEGDVTTLDGPSVAIVGTRGCSPYGASVAHRIAWACAREGITVVSGLARGIDTHAHQGALAGAGPTVAVLGHGLMHTAPPSNRELRRRIVQRGGAMVSTWPDPVPPSKQSFPRRNEWIAALASHLVVVEAPARSGALHTANLKLANDDRVFVVPGPFGDEGWRGSNGLFGYGAQPLVDVDVLLDALAVRSPVGRRHSGWLAAVLGGSDLSEAARVGGMSTVELMNQLTRLELEGTVVRLPGGRYAPAGEGP